MKREDLLAAIARGEDSARQFKANLKNSDALASEMAAFANSEGGTIFIGVADDSTIPGLSREDVVRINELISNAASQHVRSPLTVQTENVRVPGGFRGASGQRLDPPGLSGQRHHSPFRIRQSHRDHQPRPSAQQSYSGENLCRYFQYSEPDSCFVCREGAVALPRPRLRDQTGAGQMAGYRLYRRSGRLPVYRNGSPEGNGRFR